MISSKLPPALASSLPADASSCCGLARFLAWRDAVDDATPRVCRCVRARSAATAEGGARSAPGAPIAPKRSPPDRGRTADDDPRRGAVSVANIARGSARSAPRVGAGAEDAAATAEATRRRR